MNRKEFLAIIPALGSLPFIGKQIIKEEKKIIIEEPKEIEIVHDIPPCSIEPSKLTFLMCYDGKVIGSATQTEVGMSEGWMDGYSLDIPSDRHIRPRLEVRASFNQEEVIKAMVRSRNYY